MSFLAMPSGRVKWFSLEKGFGFISNDEGEDVYLAAAALPNGVTTVKPGTKLEFSINQAAETLTLPSSKGHLGAALGN